ncbi:hypothetical protein BOH72_26310 [Mycobacterium sp. WY10]|nr:hypothetical protein BOH72_26310 [Mycobacterium sp. WY10]
MGQTLLRAAEGLQCALRGGDAVAALASGATLVAGRQAVQDLLGFTCGVCGSAAGVFASA